MSALFSSLLDVLTSLVNSMLPTFSLPEYVITNVASAISVIQEFLQQANFIVPLADIVLIIKIDISIRLFKLALFGGNWVIRRIVDAIP